MTKQDDMPISDASEPYDIATRSPQYTRARWWSDQLAQRETRAILYELANLERDAARACAAAGEPVRRDGHLERARAHQLRADQLVEMPLAPAPLTASLPYPADRLACAHDPTEVLQWLDENDRAVDEAAERALRSPRLLPSERKRLRRQVEPIGFSVSAATR